ncbi:YeeE/YedE family protein [Diaphorobacter aerolatus]|uniref:YeeE/YedE family protein n=1 Tax=Diaphorobacter aerolatus TaxID=1288495 RepID=A0A7H0GLT6_9BURK|nr:YeeE/YedE family protein [Diaphorobacter aerolatus]QNP49252.1 YeeE/YedE family protein [Diaphorobacter aerolatus]
MTTILWDSFHPGSALAGGVLIGVASAMLIVLIGRIAGISGIVGTLMQRDAWAHYYGWGWRLAFVAGLLVSPLVWQLFAPLPAIELPNNPRLIVLAGLLVGFGTRLGSGCTSGHGVCGISRLSRRSLVATLTFIVFGALTVYVMRHVLH